MNPIEGYFLETDENYIFEVKGVLHPKNRIIAYLRYVPYEDGDRKSTRGDNYRKLPYLTDREIFLREYAPQYIWFDDIRGRDMQAVPDESISIIYDPIDALRYLRDGNGHLNSIRKSTVELAEILVEYSGISWESIGVTGSQLVGLSNDESDIDLVIYGSKAGRNLFQAMSEIKGAENQVKSYSEETLKQHTVFRWGKKNQHLDTLMKIEKEKKLQGLYHSIDFFIRLVKLPSDLKWQYGDCIYKNMGISTVVCHIVDDSESIYTPSRYQVECNEINDLREIVSYRGRYGEHVMSGMNVEVCGRLEEVTLRAGDVYKHLILGERPDDFMLPLI